MWKLIKIQSENIVSFQDMNFELAQGVATLIFGQNNDSEKQKCNGSGKSSFVEAVSFGITGEPMRKVNIEEIINDFSDEAWVRLCFQNEDTIFEVYRSISRNRGQMVKCKMFSLDNLAEIKKDITIQATVADYNKFILETLGITKSELYSSYILSNNKYKSFFRASDREKKEIINRFSNGVLVDESIEKLEADIEPVQKEFDEKYGNVRMITARIEAIDEQIKDAEQRTEQRKLAKAERIKELEAKIAERKTQIGNIRQSIRNTKEHINSVIDFEDDMCELEKKDYPFDMVYSIVKERADAVGIEVEDYQTRAKQCTDEIKLLNDKISAKQKELSTLSVSVENARKRYGQIKKTIDEEIASNKDSIYSENKTLMDMDVREKALNAQMAEINRSVIENDNRLSELRKRISELQNILHGTITCPKCSHQFLINSEISIEDAHEEMDIKCVEYDEAEIDAKKLSDGLADKMKMVQAIQVKRMALMNERDKRNFAISQDQNQLFSANNVVNELVSSLNRCKAEIDSIQESVKTKTQSISNLKKTLFDSVFDLIDLEISKQEKIVSSLTEQIKDNETGIETYNTSIEELESSSDSDIVVSLRNSSISYRSDLSVASEELDKIGSKLDVMKKQEQYFVEFKSYLANTKIDAISKITNSFLEQIGSDLRVELSGFKMLKSGKIRENITIRVLRDGMDCGSFDKLSGGERARVCLANILAMHSLTNSNCEIGHGLDLLIIDEVLDCSDESGLASYCEVFNKLGVTSMIITQGLVSESYPYKMLVVKENGISTIK